MLRKTIHTGKTGFGIAVTGFLLAALLSPLSMTSQAIAENVCKPVHGRFHSEPRTPCDSPVGFCTQGETIGGMQASFTFSMSSQSLTGHPEIPTVITYTGVSDISLKSGGQVTAIDTGALDLNPFGDGHFGSLLTFVHPASGHIVLSGNLDLATGKVTGDYTGELCLP